MIKVVCLFKRKAGLSHEEFRTYYENNHVKLFEDHLKQPGIERYVRRYLTPVADSISGQTRDSGFDVIMEVWISDPALFDAFYGGSLDTAFREVVAADEAKFFDRDHMYIHTVDEVDTPLPAHH